MKNYTVYRVYQHSNQKHILYENLTREEAQTIAQASPDTEGSMVVFDKQ